MRSVCPLCDCPHLPAPSESCSRGNVMFLSCGYSKICSIKLLPDVFLEVFSALLSTSARSSPSRYYSIRHERDVVKVLRRPAVETFCHEPRARVMCDRRWNGCQVRQESSAAVMHADEALIVPCNVGELCTGTRSGSCLFIASPLSVLWPLERDDLIPLKCRL